MLHFRGIDKFIRFKRLYLKNNTEHRLNRHDFIGYTVTGVSRHPFKDSRRPYKRGSPTEQGGQNCQQESITDCKEEVEFGQIPAIKGFACQQKNEGTQTKGQANPENQINFVFS